jgi:hypothetical protein
MYIMHIYMEVSQGNSVCSNLSLKQAKMSFFFLFSCAKSENKRVEQVLSREVVGTTWREEVVGKGGRRVNMVRKLYTCI